MASKERTEAVRDYQSTTLGGPVRLPQLFGKQQWHFFDLLPGGARDWKAELPVSCCSH
jgi:hypothetical protein